LGRSGQRPELSQVTGMALVRCILGKFLGVVCHCFPPCNRHVQFNYFFPQPDMALSNWKSSSLDLSVPLESQHNKFCSFFFSIAVQLITPSTQTLIASTQQYPLQYLPRWEHIVSYHPAATTL
jgi:hypothetical protein